MTAVSPPLTEVETPFKKKKKKKKRTMKTKKACRLYVPLVSKHPEEKLDVGCVEETDVTFTLG